MKKLFAFLFLLPLLAQGAGYPPSSSTSTASILTILTNNNPAIDGNYQDAYSPSSTGTQPNKLGTGSNSDYRNAGAAFSGIYSRQYAGSASALADMPQRGEDTWEGKRKPVFSISTRVADGIGGLPSGSKFSVVTNLVNTFVTNGYIQAWTNLGAPVSLVIENQWLTNYRSSQGFMCFNTNRFPGIGGTGGYIGTNISWYIRTNGIEPWLMFYSSDTVPASQYWPAFYSYTFADYSGNTTWDNSGANPFGVNEYNISMNPESVHRDISSIYANDFGGVIFLNIASSSAGYFEQEARNIGYSVRYPYLLHGNLATAILTDGPWTRYSAANTTGNGGRNATHPMYIGMMMGTFGIWEPKFSSDANTLIIGSNEGITPPTGSLGIGWCMSQIKFESYWVTNNYGYCHMSMAGDGFVPNTYTYTDWYSWACVNAFFNCNPWLMGNSDGAFPTYTTAAAFLSIGKNQNWINVNQDVTGKPPTCDSINTNNSVWHRKMTDGSTLVFMENEAGTTTNLTVTFGQLGLVSNTIVSAVECAATNGFIGTFTNSITWTVPIRSAFMFKIPPQILADSSTNSSGQMFWDSANNSVEIVGANNRRAIRINGGGSGEVAIGTNDPPTIAAAGRGLTIQAPNSGSTSRTLMLLDAGGGAYDLVRDGTTGNMRLIGGQSVPFTGLQIEDATSEFARFTGQGIYMSTNPIAQILAAPLTRGGYGLWNSNSTPYLFRSEPAGATWTTTNLLNGYQLSATAGDATSTSTTFGTTGLYAYLAAGHTYQFQVEFYLSDSTSADGAKIDFNGGTATATTFRVQTTAFDTALNLSSQATALATSSAATTFTGSGAFECHGYIKCNAAGTFIPRFAQNAHTAGTLTLFQGSFLRIFEVPQ